MGNPAKKIHPLTGEQIRPLWVRPDGREMWPMMGGDDTVDPTPTPDPTPPADPAPNPPAPNAPAPSDKGKQPPWGAPENFDADKAWELIQNLRSEKGDPAKVAELEGKVSELTTAQQQQMDAIAKALGLKSDDTPPDPEALTREVTAAQEQQRAAQRELAIYKRAGALDTPAAAEALLDSASFLDSIKDVDPTDQAAIDTAIKAAVEANPDRFAKAAPAATPPFPGGPRTPAPSRAGSLGDAIANRIATQRR